MIGNMRTFIINRLAELDSNEFIGDFSETKYQLKAIARKILSNTQEIRNDRQSASLEKSK